MENKYVTLPERFTERMTALLGDEAVAFFESLKSSRYYGLRRNPLKGAAAAGFFEALKPIPWTGTGYYYEEELRPGKHPYHEAGLYYIQEPSAMAAAEALIPRPGERILDLCAAPGGKSTHAAGFMDQQGLLVCNEIHPARAKILSQNIERMGIANAAVTNMEPAALVPVFREFFDGILVDAPCSGEGMFRKDETAIREWSEDHVKLCAARQDTILDCAAAMLRPGGRIVYSTCTFAPEENEQSVSRFLLRHPEFTVRRPDIADWFSPGRPEWACLREESDHTGVWEDNEGMKLSKSPDADQARILAELKDTVRIWPHKAAGEGHFLALLIKCGDAECAAEAANSETSYSSGRLSGDEFSKAGSQSESALRGKSPAAVTRAAKSAKKKRPDPAAEGISLFEDFCRETLVHADRLLAGRRFLLFGDNLYLAPDELPAIDGLRVLRPGLHVGTLKKGRLEPSHALAMFLHPDEVRESSELGSGDLAARYLRGEAIAEDALLQESLSEDGISREAQPDERCAGESFARRGWVLATADGCSLGWSKAAGGVLKNHYPKGLRKG